MRLVLIFKKVNGVFKERKLLVWGSKAPCPPKIQILKYVGSYGAATYPLHSHKYYTYTYISLIHVFNWLPGVLSSVLTAF